MATTVGAFLRTGGLTGVQPLSTNRVAKIPLPQTPSPTPLPVESKKSQLLPAAVVTLGATPSFVKKGSQESPQSFLIQKLRNLAIWLGTLQPVIQNPELINSLNQFDNLFALEKFIDWFRQDIIPKLPMGDKEAEAKVKQEWMHGERAKAVIHEFIIGYGLLPSQFRSPEIEKMLDYFYMFEDVISRIPK